MTAYTVNLDPIVKLTRDQFYELCAANPELKLERNANGELVALVSCGLYRSRRYRSIDFCSSCYSF